MILKWKLVKTTYKYFITFSFQIFCPKNLSANCLLHTVELYQTRWIFSSSIFFIHLVWTIVFWPYCPNIQNFKLQFQPLPNKIGRNKNLACLIELDKMERANDENVRHAWAQTLFSTGEHFRILKFYRSKLIDMAEWVKK